MTNENNEVIYNNTIFDTLPYTGKNQIKESEIQKQIIQYCNIMNIYCFAVPNGEARASYVNGKYDARTAMITGKKLKSQGVRAGVSDLIVIHNGKVIFVEVKTQTGKQSESQKEFENICKENKQSYYLVRDVVEFIKLFEKKKEFYE
jgi:hypothetical protein